MTKRKERKKTLLWIEPKQPCGCQIEFSKLGAIKKVNFCSKHMPKQEEKKHWSLIDLTACLIENLEVNRQTILWNLKQGINDSCFHCEKENALSKHEILKQFVRLFMKIGRKDGRIFSVGKKECPFCHKPNFLYCEIINFKGENKSDWDYYPFPTKEHVEAYMREMNKGNIENAQMYKPKGLRPQKEYIV